MALGVGPGDAVLVPSFTFTATAEAPALLGATPIFIDVAADTFNITADALARGTRTARAAGLKPVAAIPVDLFGQPADYDSLAAVATREHVTLLADAAQSFGASLGNRKVGALAPLTTTSFYPSKPFGCYGDGGAVMTDDADLADRLRQIRTHGQRRHRDDVVCIGLTSRLDTIQAAILIEKLAIFDDECRRRDHAARRYAELLGDAVEVPRVVAGRTSVWAQYTVLSPRRDAIAAALKAEQIACSIFYPVPVHQQGPYRGYPVAEGGLPVTVRLAKEAISLPLHPYLSSDDQARVALAVVRAAA
jgi:dTDP-4-amino-4,6-dideoxygalactose transaminase